ncbi:hypothetical protein FOVSG1_006569 [Fusarium oxysporum f. sp. vasinfectum]
MYQRSQAQQTHIHLDATAGREVVYCHACANEWYRDQNGLICPECHGEVAEIVYFSLLPLCVQAANHDNQIDPDNDPRDFDHHTSASTPPERHPYNSDLEEADIDEHTHNGFTFRWSVQGGPDHPHHHHDPAVGPTLVEREQPAEQTFGPRIHWTTFTFGPFGGGTTSVTIVSGPIHAVYSQEDLGRIITSLMEANPQSNAAPPATEEALRNLERQPVDGQMLGSEGKAECTICINVMKEGDMATFLPCNHWFHEECVTLWLKEHNTCPICRTPIEQTDRGDNNNSGSGNNNGDGNQSQPH